MARGVIRKPSFNKIVGAYRSQWKRFWRRLFSFGLYGKKGVGWFTNPKKAWYNFWYNRTSISAYRLFGGTPSRGTWFGALLVACVVCLFTTPVDATQAAIQIHKIKKNRKERTARVAAERLKNTPSAKRAPTTTSAVCTPKKPTLHRTTQTIPSPPQRVQQPAESVAPHLNSISVSKPSAVASDYVSVAPFAPFQTTVATTPAANEQPQEQARNEDTPKSKPKNAADQYIRKRMLIAGVRYCERDAVAQLVVGSYIELIPEPENPHDTNAVALYYHGAKIGYIAKKDALPFKLSLQLGRSVYGVITEIAEQEGQAKYEYETWYAK